jgi:uncharacterized membrane protein YbhN (UPF0104 family)
VSAVSVAPDAAPDRNGRGLAGRLVPAAVTCAALVALGVAHWRTVRAGQAALTSADAGWLALALVAVVAVWLAGTAAALGALPVRAPLGLMLTVQLAANFINHLLPAGCGGVAVNVRFLRRHGLGWSGAVAATGLCFLAGLIAHGVLLLGTVAASPGAAGRVLPVQARPASLASVGLPWLLGAVALLGLLATVLVRVARRGALRRALAQPAVELRRLAEVLRDPYRAAALWLGSLAGPLLHSLVLYAVLRSLGTGLALGSALVIYLVVSSLSALIPSPGGFGALDATLLAGLLTVGVPTPTAVGAVLGYRLVTVWIPLLPGALAFTLLVRRRLI